MRNAFIVSAESYKGPITAEGLRTALHRSWDRFSGVTFRVEEGGIGDIAYMVRDYLEAEEALEKFTAENHITEGQSLNSLIGEKWRKLYDKVREKRTTMIETLRQYGQMV